MEVCSIEISIRQSTRHTLQSSGRSETDKAYQRIIHDHKARPADNESIRFQVEICMNIGGECVADS